MTPKRPLARGRAIPLAAMLLVLAAALGARLAFPAAAGRSLEAAYDALTRAAPRAPSAAPVRIVDIDEASLTRLGQWPWPRLLLADLVERLREAGAAAVAFDMVFAEHDRTSPAAVVEPWPLAPELRQALAALPDHDEVLARAIAGGGVVSGFVLVNDPSKLRLPAAKAGLAWAGEKPRDPGLVSFPGALPTLAPLEAAAEGNGALNFLPGSDGVVRRVPVLLRAGDAVLPSLAAEALRVAHGASNYLVQPAEDARGGVESVRVGPQSFPTDRQASLWLRLAEPHLRRAIPAWEVLARTPRLADAAGAIVFVGTSAEALRDLRFTPLGVVPGVEVHAQLVEQLLDGRSLVRPSWADIAELGWIAVAGLVVAVVVLRARPLVGAAVTTLAVAGGGAAAFLAFAQADLLLDPIYPAAALVAIFLAGSVPLRIASERERQWVRGAFSAYVSPNLVEHLIEHPEQLRLGGERRECSFVMTDIAGFTAFVEKTEPEAVVALLDAYLDGMVRVAFAHGGTLDRVVGDAVAVMFSAPVPQEDHAARAVACALDMDRFASRFRRERREAGLAMGRTRIGVNTGPVLVGNVGGTALDYRALGDAVNTAARLETVNRYLGTRICVAAETVGRCPSFSGRPVGRLLLAGKRVPIEAWEPLTEERAGQSSVAAYREAFRLLEIGDPAAPEIFARLAAEFPDDALIAFHHQRLAEGERGTLIAFAAK